MPQQRLQLELRMAGDFSDVPQDGLLLGVMLDEFVTQCATVNTRSRASATPVQKFPREPTIRATRRATASLAGGAPQTMASAKEAAPAKTRERRTRRIERSAASGQPLSTVPVQDP
jgi:hypothetical protein